jgi:uncharacterized DUF497 family protein
MHVGLRFSRDPAKAASNLRKHGISFAEAETAFGDPLSISIPDPDHSTDEERFLLIGETELGRVVVVVFTEHDEIIRIINARPADGLERREYEEG